MFLYDKMEIRREDGYISEMPEYISKNLNPAFELRPYQVQAFENFITHFENKKSPRPCQVLFHMATGSGKTLIMAGLMLYLYKQGYRNFLFFVNLTNIIDKTKENFLNSISTKYLFADEITIDGEKIKIKAVENFQSVDEDAINICFETTQGLHTKMFMPRENDMSFEDFNDKKIVLISDEAHHLNVDTRSNTERTNSRSWEQTVKAIFNKNAENILLEFTATCELENAAIKAAYEDKIIFNYPLQNFYEDKYSKDIISLRSDFEIMDKALQALILSQYRLKIFQDNRLSVKPVILFKSAKIEDSKNFMSDFIDTVKNLSGEKLQELSTLCQSEIMERAFKYFNRNKISFEMLAAELREDFSEIHCISVNNDNDAEKNQLLLNSLESPENPYRAIFEVKKLDEGWDVLNLFDIVRLYETRQSGGRSVAPATISEAQLIGRGSRYYPFKIDDEQPKFQRKYDSDASCELRTCETLYYHCQNDSRYIGELRKALKEIGLDIDKVKRCEYKLKESFKSDNFYKNGVIFLNDRKEKARPVIFEISPTIRNTVYSFKIGAGNSGLTQLMTDKEENFDVKIYTVQREIREIAAINFAIVNKALMKYPIYKFCNLKKIFPALTSTRQFVTDEKYLGGIKIEIKSSSENPNTKILYKAVFDALGKIAAGIVKPEIEYEGTKDFKAHNVRDIFDDKTVNYSDTHGDGVGISQNDPNINADLKIDLSKEDWFAHTDNFGTSEEKAFVKYFSQKIDDLRKNYSKIYLVRSERHFHIYSFDEGRRFEPDYVLFLQKNDGDKFEQWQIFIEPKGTHLLQDDKWKENFLLELKENAVVKDFADDNQYLIRGFHFFNQDKRLNEFESDFMSLV